MSTSLSFSSKATKSLTPTTAKVHLSIITQNKKQDEAFDELKSKLNTLSTTVKELASFKKDSYVQTKFQTRKDAITKKNYSEKVMGYKCWVNLYFSLNYGDTAVEDLAKVINLSIDNDLTCEYEFVIDNNVLSETYDALYITAVNNGYERTKKLTDNIIPFKGKTLELVSVDSFRANLESPKSLEYAPPLSIRSSVERDTCYKACTSAEKTKLNFLGSKKTVGIDFDDADFEPPKPEKVTPELISEMFNNASRAVVEVSLQFCMV